MVKALIHVGERILLMGYRMVMKQLRVLGRFVDSAISALDMVFENAVNTCSRYVPYHVVGDSALWEVHI